MSTLIFKLANPTLYPSFFSLRHFIEHIQCMNLPHFLCISSDQISQYLPLPILQKHNATNGQHESHQCRNKQAEKSDLEQQPPLKLRRKRTTPAATSWITSSSDETSDDESSTSSSDLDFDKQVRNSSSSKRHPKRLWAKDRSQAWWDECTNPDFPAETFKKRFRMSRPTFEFLCQELSPEIAKEDTALRAAIPVQKRVAVCIYRLATGEPLRLMSKRFGLGISTCHKLITEVCAAMKSLLMPRLIHWPNEDSVISRNMSEFESISGIPNVIGAMYTTHIPIIAPKTNVAQYLNNSHTQRNKKPSYSVTLQGVVDPRGIFTDVCIGWPGSLSDEQVLQNSALFRRTLTSNSERRFWVVGGPTYPLTDSILVPYNQQNLTWPQHEFNESLKAVQKVAKAAFARLKGRWHCLQKRSDVKVQDFPVLIGACCVLHNLCEMRGETMDYSEMGFELFDEEISPEMPLRTMSSIEARDAIAHGLLHHGNRNTDIQQQPLCLEGDFQYVM